MPNDDPKKNAENPAHKPDHTPKPKPTAASLKASLKKNGARMCPDCLGLGVVRSAAGQPRTLCKTCHGLGSLPCPDGEMEAFIVPAAEIDPTARDKTREVIKAGWQRFAASVAFRKGAPTRCYHYRVVGNDLPLYVVTEAQIDAAFKAGGREAVIALATV